MATIRFLIQGNDKNNDRPNISIRLRINDYKKVQTTVPGILAYRNYWSNSKQTHLLNLVNPIIKEELKAINKKLNGLKIFIVDAVASVEVGDITKDWLELEVDKFLHPDKYAPKEERPKTLMQCVDDFIADAPGKIVQRKGTPISKYTILQYKQMQKYLKLYLKKQGKNDLEIKEVDKDFYNEFINYLYQCGLKLNTVGKHIKNIKAAINTLPLEMRAACEFVEPKKCVKLAEEVDNIYLTEEELTAIADAAMPSPYLDRVRDQFIMLSWTGCRYSDLPKLTRENIVQINGHDYFKIIQKKTGAKVTIPVLPPVRVILEKYDYNIPKPMSNQKFNEFVKEVAHIAGLIDDVAITRTELAKSGKKVSKVTQHQKKWECVTAHTARRSFATNMYKRDFPTLMIMKITGHSTEKAFLTYIKVSEDENAERMLRRFEEQERLQGSNR